MKTKLALISNGLALAQTLTKQVNQMQPGIEVINIVDDSNLKLISDNNYIVPPIVVKKVVTYATFAEEMGAGAILVTCSSIGEIVDIAKDFVKVPVFKIDEPMAQEAITKGSRIGITATMRTTLAPTKRLLQAKAAEAGKTVNIEEKFCEGAWEARSAGKQDLHDQIIREVVKELASKCDVIVLSQASMANAIPNASEFKVPILTSPESGIKRVLNYLSKG